MAEETIPLLFVTTSQRKFDHLQYLGERQDIRVYHVPKEYEELQRDDLEHLLSDAIKSKFLESLRDTFFIIEQTSVFFDAYENEEQGYPGQFFKRWWQNKSEQQLMADLSKNPRATIESGLTLNIPNHEPLIFTNKQRGQVTFDGGLREENQKYSWLSADDFNRYFIPDGAKKVYNQMSIRKFLKYDFRKPNFEKVSTRLQEYNSILNSGVSIESLEEKAKEVSTQESREITRQSRLDADYGT